MAVLLIARAHGLERITAAKMAGLLMSLGGVLALVMDQTGGRGAGWKGDLLIIVSACSFAFFTVESKKIASAHPNAPGIPGAPSLEFTAFAFLGATVWLSPLLALELFRVQWYEVTLTTWSSLIYSAVFGSAGAYLVYNYSLRQLPPSRAAAFHYLQPVLATVFGVMIFHDRFTTRFAVGAALILTGLGIPAGRDG